MKEPIVVTSSSPTLIGSSYDDSQLIVRRSEAARMKTAAFSKSRSQTYDASSSFSPSSAGHLPPSSNTSSSYHTTTTNLPQGITNPSSRLSSTQQLSTSTTTTSQHQQAAAKLPVDLSSGTSNNNNSRDRRAMPPLPAATTTSTTTTSQGSNVVASKMNPSSSGRSRDQSQDQQTAGSVATSTRLDMLMGQLNKDNELLDELNRREEKLTKKPSRVKSSSLDRGGGGSGGEIRRKGSDEIVAHKSSSQIYQS